MFEKFTYWIDKSDFQNFQSILNKTGNQMVEAKKAVCTPLRLNVNAAFIPPESWERYKLCRRQLSWYGKSRFAGKYLIVSNSKLDNLGLIPNTIIRESAFKPDQLPGRDPNICRELISRPSYSSSAPEKWEDFTPEEIAEQDKRMAIMGVRGIKFEDLFLVHCANHANFIEPRFFYKSDINGISPYTIDHTKRICSACLEFYNIIGEYFKKKYVVPCPGSVLFAGMKVNSYYEVETASVFQKK